MWCHRCISYDVAVHYMWCHVWCHSVISQLCDIIVQNLWYHMWNHRLQRNTSCVISHSFFHITPWYHIWHHSMISHVSIWHHICDITHDITTSMISHMISHPCRQLKRLPARRCRQVGMQEDQALPRRRSPSSRSRHLRPPPRRRRRRPLRRRRRPRREPAQQRVEAVWNSGSRSAGSSAGCSKSVMVI